MPTPSADPDPKRPTEVDATAWTGDADRQVLPHRVDGQAPLQRMFARYPLLAATVAIGFAVGSLLIGYRGVMIGDFYEVLVGLSTPMWFLFAFGFLRAWATRC